MNLPRFIDASAGTGKTHVLAWYYLSALAQAREPEGVVACTFTVAATAEFRDRVRHLLSLPGEEFTEQAAQLGVDVAGLDRQDLLARLPALEIRTLDSLFLRLLQRAAPGTTARLPTPVEATEAFTAAFGRWMEEDPARISRLGTPHGGDLAQVLRDFAQGAEGYPEEEIEAALLPPTEEEQSAWQEDLLAETSGRVEAALGLLPANWRPSPRSGDRVAKARAALEAWQADRLVTGGALAKALGALVDAVTHHSALPLAALGPLEEARAAVREVDGLVPDNDPRRLPSDLLVMVRVYGEALAARGLLGPSGVAVRLLAALDAGATLGEDQPEWILVDEYQDTSPLQGRVLDRVLDFIAAGGGGATVVGDEKQAIYRFRGASTGPFRRARERVGEEGRRRLFLSWRSGPAVLAAVNWLMEGFLAGLEGATLSPDPRAPRARDEEPVPLTVWAWAHPAQKKNTTHLMRSGDPGLSPGPVARAVDAVSWLAAERPGESVLVLGPRWGQLAAMARRLAARGVPVRVAGDPHLLADPDVADLGSALRVLAWPEDPVHSLALLRGPAFAFTVAELAECGEEVEAARAALAGWSGQVAAGSAVAAVLADLLAATGWLEGLGADPRGHERRLRVLEALDWLRAAESEGTAAGPRALADLLAGAAEQGHRVHAPAPGAAQEGTVTVRTIHGAKGLEADHVVVVDPERGDRLGAAAPALPPRQGMGRPAKGKFEPDADGRLGGLWLPLPRPGVPVWQSHGFMAAWKAGREEESRERVNLAYVALTRAHKTAHLVVPGLLTRRDLAPGRLLATLYGALDPDLAAARSLAAGERAAEATVVLPATALGDVGLEAGGAQAVYVPAPCRRAAPAAISAVEEPEPPLPRAALPIGPPEPDREAEAAARGDWAHRVLEAVGHPSGPPDDEWRAAAAAVRYDSGPPDPYSVAWLAERLAALAALPAWTERAAAWDSSWAEYPLPGGEGPERCDLLASTGASLEVVDWKTGSRTLERGEEARAQVRGYMEGVGRALARTELEGMPVSGLVVWLDDEPPTLEEVD